MAPSLFRCSFAYFDSRDYKADDIFVSQGLYVKFLKQYTKSDVPYVIITCSVNKHDRDKFIECMELLKNKMLICGYRDYVKITDNETDKMLNGLNRSRSDNTQDS